MKILVISDSHSALSRLRAILDRARDADVVIFLGDGLSDTVRCADSFPDVPLYAVCGNCDREGGAPLERLEEFGGIKVFMTHGHRYQVKYGKEALLDAARERGASVALFGHTHGAFEEHRDGVLLFNPGAAMSGSFGLLSIQNGQVLASHGNL